MRSFRVELVGTLLFAITACDPSATDATFWERASNRDAGRDDRSEDAAGATSPSDAGNSKVDAGNVTPGPGDDPTKPVEDGGAPTAGFALTVNVTTVGYGGKYGPANVGAIWVSDTNGALVRTLETWGVKRLKNAVAWRAVARSDEVDVVSGATRKSAGAHTATWDGRDVVGATVPRGALLLNVEFTEDDSAEGRPAGPHRVVPFDTADAGVVTAPDDTHFRSITIAPAP